MKPVVSVIFGTRPEAIKLAPVIEALKKRAGLTTHVCVTGQHREMLDQVLNVFHIVPDTSLAVMTEAQTLATLTARLLTGIDAHLAAVKPQVVLAQGDTTSVLAAALAAFYHRIPFGHVEAGLRTGNLSAPWPEEANRVLTTRLTTLHFAPTAHARNALLKEGVAENRIFQTGNTIIDALRSVVARLPAHSEDISRAIPPQVRTARGRIVLITGHRRENFDGGLERVCLAIRTLAERFPQDSFVYPVHLNPVVQRAVNTVLGSGTNNVHLLPPMEYIPFVSLIERSHMVITDSGGIQEEAPALGKPVLVTREVTERPEGVASGNALLVGTDTDTIVREASRLLEDERYYAGMARAANPYGDGTAAEKIATVIESFLIKKAV